MPGIIDVHCHYYPGRYTELMTRLQGPNQPRFRHPTTDEADQVQARLEMMDAAGVQMQVLCPSSNYPYFQQESDAVEAARVCNDSFAELTSARSERFSAFVSLPLPHVEASLRELERGLDELGMAGVTMSLSVFNRSSCEQEFEPLYAELDRRGAVLFYHPAFNGLCSPLINEYRMAGAAGASMEDSAMVLQLIARGVPYRFPNIKYIVPHFGGLIPMQLNRLDNQVPSALPDLPEKPSVTARRLYYDTVGHGSQAALLCAWKAFGPEHLVTGSDYPYLMDYESYTQTFSYINDSDLPPDDVEQILHRSAASLLEGRLAARHV
jgi:predicted TIM-barrel fold metal-dependent hydrolase